ncbi:MAG: aspartate aminotransferase family protein [Anaerolineales bacterium]|nr:aspartate aminotransferase family protein [Anaerolineales bacterium]
MSDNAFVEQIKTKTKKSLAMYEKAKGVLPGGVGGNGKFGSPYPIYYRNAHGAYLTDIDGNDYIDLIMGFGIHILGHAPKPVMDAVQEQLQNGSAMPGMASEYEYQLASKIREYMPAMEMIRFVNTGSESTNMAIRVARAYRKRDKIAKFEGNYHGQHDLAELSAFTIAGPALAPEPSRDAQGLPSSIEKDMMIMPYNNPKVAVSLIKEHADELAAVIIEPVSAFGLGCIPADREFINAIRDVTKELDIPMILDEVVTNFRLGLGGGCEYFGIKPDLVCLGKIVGGGYPIGVYGGRRDLMDKYVTPTGQADDNKTKIHQSGTFSGNAVTMVAGLATIKELEKPGVYPYVNGLTDKLRTGLQGIADDLGFQMLVAGIKSLFQIHFGVESIKNRRDKQNIDMATAVLFAQGFLANGIASGTRPLFLSTAHTERDIDTVLNVSEAVLKEMKRMAK